MKKIVMTIMLMTVLLLPTNAFALDCDIPSPVVAFENSDTVIEGKVNDINEKDAYTELKVDVIKSYKGVSESMIYISEDKMWGESQSGQTYLFYLNDKGDHYENPLCSATTTTLSDADNFPASNVNQGEIVVTTMVSPNSPEVTAGQGSAITTTMAVPNTSEPSEVVGRDSAVITTMAVPSVEIDSYEDDKEKNSLVLTEMQMGYIVSFILIIALLIYILWYIRSKENKKK